MANRRETIVINKNFQYQYSILIVAITVLAVNLFVIIRMLYPSDHPLVMDMASTLGLAAIELILIVWQPQGQPQNCWAHLRVFT